MECQAFHSRCKKCGKYFGRHNTNPCPECGTPRVPCGKAAVKGYNFCDRHGGPNPRFNFYGVGTGIMKDGGSSSQFPLVRLAAKYHEIQENGRILSNRAGLEVVRERIRQLAERIDLNQAPDRLDKLQKLWTKFRQLEKDGLRIEAVEVKDQLDQEFEKAYHDYAAWKQMFEALDLDRKLVESETKILKDLNAILTAEDAYQLQAKILAVVVDTINGMEISNSEKGHALKRLTYEFTRLVGDQSDRRYARGAGEVIDTGSSEVDPDGILDPGDESGPETPGPVAPATVPD